MSILAPVWEPIENSFAAVGLSSPLSRFAAMAAVGGAIEYSIRPSYSYRGDGSPRPWILLDQSADSTYLPAGSTALLTGLFFGFFV